MAVVEEPIEQGGGQRTVARQGLIPAPEIEIGCQDNRSALIHFGNDLEDQMSLIALQRQIADLIDDQELVARD